MKSWHGLPSHRRHGFYIIGLLIVIVIIMVVMLKGPFSSDPVTQVTQYEQSTNRAEEAACSMNRMSIGTDLTNWRIMNPGQAINMDIIRRSLRIPNCPGGGAYLIDKDGTIYCSVHTPPPAEMLASMVQLTEPQAEATPPPLDAPPSPNAPRPPSGN